MGYSTGLRCFVLYLAAVTAVNAQPSPACLAAPAGLIGWWSGDGDTEDLVQRDNAILVNCTFAAGLNGQAFSFTSPNSYVQVRPNAALASLTNSLSLEAWVWHEGGGGPFQRYLTISPDDAILRLEHNMFDFVVNYGQGLIVHVRSTNAMTLRQWHHVVGTYDGSIQRLYVNGQLAGNAEVNRPMIRSQGAELYLSISGQEMNGRIDEAAVYDRALSPTEIEDHFAVSSAGMCKTLTFSPPVPAFPDQMRLLLKGPPLPSVQILTSSALGQQWSSLTTLTNFTGRAVVIDSEAGHLHQRFYRAEKR